MLKDTKSLGNNKAPACESRGFVRKKKEVRILTHLLAHKKRLCQRFDTTSWVNKTNKLAGFIRTAGNIPFHGCGMNPLWGILFGQYMIFV